MIPKSKPLMLQYLGIYFVVPFFSNFFALFLANYTAKEFLSDKFLVLFEATRLTNDLLLQIITWSPFVIVTIILIFYTLPIYKCLCEDETLNNLETAKQRVTNSPITISLLGFFGWETATVLSTIRIHFIHPDASVSSMVVITILFAFWGLFVFAFSYSLIDYLNKVCILPVLFPDGGLSKYASGKRFSIITKQAIFWISSTLFPIALLVFALLHRSNKEIFDLFSLFQTDLLFQLILIMLVSSFALSYSLAASIQDPLNEIENATDKIKNQEFSTRVIVYNSDELGVLGDAVNEMAEGLAERERIKDTFGRIVDPRVRDYLLSNEQNLGGKVVNATILFSDLRDFTKLSEKRKPEEVLYILNRYFQEMSDAIEKHGGFINKFIGDAILAVFGTPFPTENHAEQAFHTAMTMQKNLESLNHKFESENLPTLRMGIGIHTGSLLVGNIGSENRMEFTVIGDTVNTASRVEGLCKGLGQNLLITEHTYVSLPTPIQNSFHSQGEFTLKGRESREKIFSYGSE
ncbi:adenylate/guanylate cyclase domain-containing protein [Leptospira sp. 96542]|nr:adenylate/guanylate cyclase domain-containing protein [Leptospira sp. 96542]